MKKFKNIKLMLLGILAMGSMNASALNGDYKTDGTYWYWVANEAKGEVDFVGVSVTIAEPKEITVKAQAELLADDGVTKKTYKVMKASNQWWLGSDAPGKARSMTASALESITFECRTDWDADMVVDGSISATCHSYDCLSYFKGLKKIVIKEAHKVYTLPVLNTLTTLEEIDLSGVSNDGAGINVPANFIKDLANLKSVKLPENEPLVIGANAFDGIHGTTDGKPTEVRDIDISNATSIGAEAFRNAYIKVITIGENVSAMNPYAFVAPTAATAYIEKVVWKSNKLTGGDPVQPQVKAAFPGQVNIKEVVVEAANVKSIEAAAFTSAAPKDAKGNAIPFVLDLSKAPALATVAGALPDVPYKTVKLEGTALAGDDLATILGFDLATNSASTLETLTLPEGLTKITAGQFNAFTALKDIAVNVAEIPANAFKGATKLASITLGDKVAKIGANAFDGTILTTIKIPANVTSIGNEAYANIHPVGDDGKAVAVALDLSEAAKLKTLGTGVFKDTNIGAAADFSTTAVTVIPASTFEKTTATNFLTSVTLKVGSATSKVSIGANAFKNNTALATVTNLNQANYDFDADKAKGKPGIATSAFENTALTAVELDQTPITYISANAFSDITALKSVKLNAATFEVGTSAFAGDYQLATVENLNNDKLAVIDANAFNGSALPALDLSNATSLTTIGSYAFGASKTQDAASKLWTIDNPTLTSITFPEEKTASSKDTEFKNFTNKIQSIGYAAFFKQSKLENIENLKDTKITVLNELFTNVKNGISGSNVDNAANAFVIGEDQMDFCPVGLKKIELPSTKWESKDKGIIEFTTISDYALQGLGLEKIVIPSSVTSFGGCVLQGNVNLTEVEWMDAKPSSTALHKYTFRGDSNLEKFYYMTTSALKSLDLQDIFFYWCSKEKLRVYVTSESLKILEADGYTTANAKYSKLNDELTDEITLTAKNDADGKYYRTYYNNDYSTWIKASDDVKVFTAQFNGAKVEMVEADIEGGYYKINIHNSINGDAKSVAIIQSVEPKIQVEYYALAGNDKSTLKYKYNEMQVTPSEKAVSSLSYYFKLGKGPKGIGFYRITSGKFKAGAVYLQAADAARLVDFYGLDEEATGISAVKENVESIDAPVYNLQGARVNGALQKGIYVKNGKKFIVK